MRPAWILLSAPLLAACVPRYDTQPLTPNDADWRAAATFAYPPRQPPDRLNLLNDQWHRVDAACTKVRGAMRREADGIATRNSAVGALFAGASAALAAVAGVYISVRGKDADPATSAILAFGAGGTVVPTFFYLGSDDREKTVRARLSAIDERRKRVNDAWTAFKAVDREFTAASGDRAALREAVARAQAGGTDCEGLDAERRSPCVLALAKSRDADARLRESVARWHQATDALDDAVGALDDVCR